MTELLIGERYSTPDVKGVMMYLGESGQRWCPYSFAGLGELKGYSYNLSFDDCKRMTKVGLPNPSDLANLLQKAKDETLAQAELTQEREKVVQRLREDNVRLKQELTQEREKVVQGLREDNERLKQELAGMVPNKDLKPVDDLHTISEDKHANS